MPAADGFHDPQFGTAGAPLILNELEGFDDDMLGKIKKGKSLRYGVQTLGSSNMQPQFSGQESMGMLTGFAPQK